jgi:hypothetical protein
VRRSAATSRALSVPPRAALVNRRPVCKGDGWWSEVQEEQQQEVQEASTRMVDVKQLHPG